MRKNIVYGKLHFGHADKYFLGNENQSKKQPMEETATAKGLLLQKIEEAKSILTPGGKVVQVDSEVALNAVTAVSGSGPAYVFHLVEALEAGARDLGLPKDVSAQLARETIIGSAKLLESSNDSPETLRKNVTSPNGTTQAALDVLMGEDGGLSKMMIATVRAAFARAKKLGN